jgi:hypothetical protein
MRVAWRNIPRATQLLMVCGWHSNIPWHCIVWYLFDYIVLNCPARYRGVMYQRLGRTYGYIACPWCLLVRRKPNEVQRCSIDNCRRRKWVQAKRQARTKQ